LHPLIAGYLAAESLTGADAEVLAAKGELPAWELALPFAAAFLPMDKAVEARLNAPPDLLFSKLFSLANWLAEAPSDQKWRGEVFKKFTAALIAPQQFPLVRERAMTALVVSRDRNIIFIFRQGLRATDSLVRRLACIGLGAYGDPEATKDLIAMLEDQSAEVKLAAALALGSIASDTAIESMVTSLVYGEQGLRRAVAEALAALPGEGYGVLRDAIGASEMMLRHAAVFGLARIKTGWAVALLYRTLLEDEQWYVRNAAEEAFLAADDPTKTGISHLPEPDQIPWLVSWAASKGEAVPEGERARDVMLRALQEGDPGIQGAAAMSLATLGHVRALRPLYNALQDKEEYVRAVAFTALGVMQIRLGEPLPGVV
jgi:HEAT repeat protein